MTLLTLIPFGLRKSDARLVDVSDVPRGINCACVCPSCETPLIARQGEEREWHFAHASRDVYQETKQECEFSFYLSVRLMCKQLIGAQCKVLLPAYRGLVYRHSREIPYTVTEERIVELSSVKVEATFDGIGVDILGEVDGFPLGIYLEHPGRECSVGETNFDGKRVGIIAVDLVGLDVRFAAARDKGSTYEAALRDFLLADRTAKRWIYHPRKKRFESEMEEKLRELIEIDTRVMARSSPMGQREGGFNERSRVYEPRAAPVARPVVYECVGCKMEWQGMEPDPNPCPKCRSHLLKRIKAYLA